MEIICVVVIIVAACIMLAIAEKWINNVSITAREKECHYEPIHYGIVESWNEKWEYGYIVETGLNSTSLNYHTWRGEVINADKLEVGQAVSFIIKEIRNKGGSWKIFQAQKVRILNKKGGNIHE